MQDDGLMVLCAACDVWQHALCFALLSESEVPETHICVQCAQVHVHVFTHSSYMWLEK